MSASTFPQPRDPFFTLARRIRPDLAAFRGSELSARVTDTLGCLLADIRAHIGGALQSDDITLLVVKREA